MKTYPVDLATHPEAAEPLTDLYLASRSGPVNGTHTRTRRALAKAIGTGPLSVLLQSGEPISVSPRSNTVWEVKAASVDSGAIAADRLILAVRAEMTDQAVNGMGLAKKAGLHHSYVYRLLGGKRQMVTLDQAVKLLAGLGRSLSWFESHYLTPSESES